MRKQERPEPPKELEENTDRWNKQWANLRARNPTASFQWYTVKGKSARDWLLPSLRLMNQEHCSFCDSFPLVDKSEPIEHFRPKSLEQFWKLAYSWENLYYCCAGCQSSKLEKWDDRLINPDAEDYSFNKYFAFDFTTGAIMPNPLADMYDQDRAAVTIETFGLDKPGKRKCRRLALRNWSNGKNLDDFAYRDFIGGET